MKCKIILLNFIILLFYSNSFCQLKINSIHKKFESSYLIISNIKINNFTHPEVLNDTLDSTNYNTLKYRSIKIGKQVVFSQLSGGLIALGLVVIASPIIANSDDWSEGVYVMYGGYITGMALGVHIFGNDKFENAPFVKSLIGGVLGLPIGYLIFNSDPKPHGFTALAPFLFPTIGAIVSFNLSAKPR